MARTTLRATEVYNLTVAREHNYFAEGVLVHNKSVSDGSSLPDAPLTDAVAVDSP